MPTNYPTSFDSLPDPDYGLPMSDSDPKHSEDHQNVRDAVKAIETKVGIDDDTNVNSLDKRVANLEQNGGGHPDLTAHDALGLATDTELSNGLAGKANTSHSHAQGDVTNLTNDLSGKASTSHNHDSSYSATGHNHDTTYVNEIDHDKTAHDALGIDAATLDGVDSTGFATSGHSHPAGDATTLDGIDSTGFATSGHTHGSYITSGDVTYENLNANSDVGTGSSQVAQGNHTHDAGAAANFASMLKFGID